MAKIYIAAGHGGKDPGASANGLNEKDFTLAISNIVAEKLRAAGHEIFQNRTTDIYRYFVDDTTAANAISGLNAFVVIHLNANSGTPGTGVEAYYSFTGQGKVLATNITSKIAELGFKNRGPKTLAIEGSNPPSDYFHVIRQSHMDATLVECCFINNPSDMYLMNVEKMAQAITDGILLAYPATVTAPVVVEPDYKTLYTDVLASRDKAISDLSAAVADRDAAVLKLTKVKEIRDIINNL